MTFPIKSVFSYIYHMVALKIQRRIPISKIRKLI